jgi:4'-phosphopantetheinyl transferase
MQFRANPYGKPQLIPCHNPANIQFNLAHSHDLAVCAVTRCHPVGIDLEQHREIPEAATVLKYYTSDDAQQHALTSTVNPLCDTLFKRWVCTEAFLKARGTGFTPIYTHPRPLHSHTAGSSHVWSLWTFVPAPEYSAAVVTDTPYLQLQFHDIPDIL